MSPRTSARGAFSAICFAFTLLVSETLAFTSLWPQHQHERAARLLKRDKINATIPNAISIGPSQYWEGYDGPWSSFPLQVGSGSVSGAQQIRVFPSTAATEIWTIAAKGCPSGFVDDCANARGGLFLPNESLTWQGQSSYYVNLEDNLGMNTGGEVGYDTATLGFGGSGGPTAPHNVVFNLASSTYWLGVFGMNPRPTNLTETLSQPQPSFMQQIYSNDGLPSLSYAYTAGAQYRLDAVFGSLTLGGYDANAFVANNVTFPFYEDQSRDLSVNLQSVSIDAPIESDGPTNLLPGGSISILIDSTISQIWLPENACLAFEQAFGIQYNDTYSPGVYLVNDTQHQSMLSKNPNVKFTLGPQVSGGPTVDIVLPYKAFDKQIQYPYVLNRNPARYFPLQRAANSTQYTLGRTFLQEAYLIADYDRMNFSVSQRDWTQSNVQTQKITNILSQNLTQALAQQQKQNRASGLSAGAIAGIVIAVVVLIAIVGLALFLIRWRKAQLLKRLAGEPEADDASAAMAKSDLEGGSAAEKKPFVSRTAGGELGADGEIHELNVADQGRLELGSPYKFDPAGNGYSEMDSPYKLDPNKVGYSEMEGGDYFGPGNGPGWTTAGGMDGREPAVFEMHGSDVHVQEMETPERRASPGV